MIRKPLQKSHKLREACCRFPTSELLVETRALPLGFWKHQNGSVLPLVEGVDILCHALRYMLTQKIQEYPSASL
jgi:hypothetical protein